MQLRSCSNQSCAYGKHFYDDLRGGSIFAARTILKHVFDLTGSRQSVVDIGCGTGAWLSVAAELGASDIVGIEGPWLDPAQTDISSSLIVVADLAQHLSLPRRFDLAICLEVAEHLPSSRAHEFIADVCAASDCVLFSAAVPRQGGTFHINEQWQSYWIDLFSLVGYRVFDCLRPMIWNETKIPVWYRQNIFLFVNETDALSNRVIEKCSERQPLFDVIHPELYFGTGPTPIGVRGAMAELARAIARKLFSYRRR